MERQITQDTLWCDICEAPISPLYCDICQKHLCKNCVLEHLFDGSENHKIVPYEKRETVNNYPHCEHHPNKECELQCKKCQIPICILCVASGEHEQHEKEDILNTLTNKKTEMKNDLRELENFIYPAYQEAASKIPDQKGEFLENSQKMETALTKQGESLHNEIDLIINSMISEVKEQNTEFQRVLDVREKQINQTINEMSEVIRNLKQLLKSSDVCRISAYKSQIEQFKIMPSQPQVTLPTFMPRRINKDLLYQQIGSLSKPSVIDKENPNQEQVQDGISSLSPKLLLDEPLIVKDNDTAYSKEWPSGLQSVACLRDNDLLWTCGSNEIMRLYNLKGELKRSVQTKSRNEPHDIAVTQGEDLLYTDASEKSLNIVKGTDIQTLITIQGWKPQNLCCTSAGDILVVMESDDEDNQTKIVRYSGSTYTEMQSIQSDNMGQPLYSAGDIKYLTENKNLDICLADSEAGTLIVVNAEGNVRFRYTGPPSSPRKQFNPRGITTDSQGKILTVDSFTHYIHILDQDGHFLRYIANCGLVGPCGLSVNSRDSLFVAEYTGSLKEIQYYK